MRVFISSVRRGLEEERDALPGALAALGYTPVRFEDYTAQPLPSRQACLVRKRVVSGQAKHPGGAQRSRDGL
jgi:hypothetical protein